jgi:hypothetical protein
MSNVLFPTLTREDERFLVYQPPVLPRLTHWCVKHQQHLMCTFLGVGLLYNFTRVVQWGHWKLRISGLWPKPSPKRPVAHEGLIPIEGGWIEVDEEGAAELTLDENRWVLMRFTAQGQMIAPFVTDLGCGPGVVIHPLVSFCWSSAQVLRSQVESAGEQLGVMLIPTDKDFHLFHQWELDQHSETAGTQGFYEPVISSDHRFVSADHRFIPWTAAIH